LALLTAAMIWLYGVIMACHLFGIYDYVQLVSRAAETSKEPTLDQGEKLFWLSVQEQEYNVENAPVSAAGGGFALVIVRLLC
jgi:hypothetical protein